MTEGDILRLSERRKVSLLRSLRVMNLLNLQPNMAELVRHDDGRAKMPLETLIARRGMIRDLVERGYAKRVNDINEEAVRLCISERGVARLKELGY